ncbi:hypothetical protein HPB49_020763 [Dermacentor silvarum]|uniref:Uncharacterized protein n=1 Tax=Dermacentor silvarum TaxID=543639 RepID=A0ACB8DKW6_DERSI|nr:hypothetical protein HPB49_020763 [Dermacentor silvarum]
MYYLFSIMPFLCSEGGNRPALRLHCVEQANAHSFALLVQSCLTHAGALEVLWNARSRLALDTIRNRRLIQCDQCNYRCSSRSYMRIHARVHTGERPFRCNICPSAFTDPSNLNRHKRCHTGERPFVCRHCKQHFTQSSSLRTHMLYQHGHIE